MVAFSIARLAMCHVGVEIRWRQARECEIEVRGSATKANTPHAAAQMQMQGSS